MKATVVALLAALLAACGSADAQWGYGYGGYGGYGYGLRGIGGYGYGYPQTSYYGGYGYGYPVVYGRRLQQASPAPETMMMMDEPDASLCPLSLEDNAEFKQTLIDLASTCTAEKAALGEDKLAEFCSACVVPGQTALGKAAFEWIQEQQEAIGNDTEAIREAVKPLQSKEGERACGKLIVDFIAEQGVPIDEAFMEKANKCGEGFDERSECIFTPEEDARLSDIASTCATTVPAIEEADAESVKAYCQGCYWPLIGITIDARLQDDELNEPTPLKCALKVTSELYTSPDEPPSEEMIAAERRLADAMFTDRGLLHCANNANSAVSIQTGVNPIRGAPAGIPQKCWMGPNRPAEDVNFSEAHTKELLDSLQCPPIPEQ